VPPVVFENGKLKLGAPVLRTATRQFNGRGFVSMVKPGDWISIHWNWACDLLTQQQLKQLQWHTQHALNLANLAL
jgi:hypothetical protein